MGWFRKLFSRKNQGDAPLDIKSETQQPAPHQPFFAVFLDVETTGLQNYDRVVSLGAIRVDINNTTKCLGTVECVHLIFDPIKKSHPRAEAVHGYDDWLLRHQDRFSDFAEDLHQYISSADLVVAHNAKFDFKFVNREFELCGLTSPINAGYCTLEAFHEKWPNSPASLSFISRQLNLVDQGQHHNALKDAWLAMNVYFLINQHSMYGMEIDLDLTPANIKEPPPRPPGPLPRRNNKRPLQI